MPGQARDDVIKALGVGLDALEAGDVARALRYLEWCKSVAPRSPVVRETLGVTHYGAGDFVTAQTELLAYRRLSGKADQNHLLADCARAAGRHDRVVEYIDEMVAADVDRARVVEGIIVMAGDRADRGDVRGALDVLARADLDPSRVESWHPRVWYVGATLCERLGEVDQAREFLEAILAVDEDFYDTAERLAALQ
ncbi:MAG: tetratricopeptide repeat protein [Egibacteraceae bacterium]